MRKPEESVTMMSIKMADKLISIRTKLENANTMRRDVLLAIIEDMGALCVFEDFTNDDEVNGAMHILDWIETHISN